MKYPEVARRFKEALDDAGMKAQELADLTGIGKSSISQYVNGSFCPNNIRAGQIADVLHVSPAWLMGFDVPKVLIDSERADRDFDLLDQFHRLSPENQEIIMNMIKALSAK